jgi:hypothetical protein
MTDNPTVLIAGIIALLVAVVVVVYLRGGLHIGYKKGEGLRLRAQGGAKPNNIVVADQLQATDIEIGNIVGSRGSAPTGDVNVLGKASIERGKMGDIIGYDGRRDMDPEE